MFKIAWWTRVLEIEPNNVEALVQRGSAYRELGDPVLARKDIDRAIELEPASSKGWTERGHLETTLGRYQSAVDNFSKAIQLNPSAGWSYYHRGRAYASWYKVDLALADFQRSIDLLGDGAYLPFAGMGVLYVGQRNRDLGSLWLNRSIEILDEKIAKAGQQKCSEHFYEARGHAALSAGRHNDAFRDLNEALRQKPDSAQALYYRGWVYLAVGANSQALTDLNLAIRLAPIRSDFYNLRAKVHDRLKNSDSAEADRAMMRELAK